MRRRLIIAALLCSTAITAPARAEAGPVALFVQGLAASFTGAGAIFAGATGALGAGLAVGTFFTSTFIGQTLLSIGLSVIADALTPKPTIPAPAERLVNFAQPITPMASVFGRVRKGGPYAVTAFENARRHYAVIIAAHRIDGIEGWYVDQRPVTVRDNGEVSSPPYWTGAGLPDVGQGTISLRPYLGAPGQTADAVLIAGIPEWTSAHDMAGLAYVAAYARRVAQARFSEVYGNSPATGPTITPVVRGALVYDPRTETTAYSNNAALIWAWIITERLGGTVDWAEVAEEADVCDEVVLDRDGNPQPRWTLNGTFDDASDFETLRNQIVGACDGYTFERPDGSIGLRVGRWIEPVITLTADDFLSLDIAENDWGPSPATEFVARYVEPDHDHLEAASGTWSTGEPGLPVRKSPSLFFVDSHNQAIRCLKRIARVTRARYSVSAEIGLIGYDLIAHRFVRINALGFDFVCEIGRITRGEGFTTLRIGGKSATAEDFAFDAALEEPLRPPRDETTSSDVIPVPTGLAGSPDAPFLTWTWDAQPPEFAQRIRWRAEGATDWSFSPDQVGDSFSWVASPVSTGTDYEAQIANVTASQRLSDWSALVTVTA